MCKYCGKKFLPQLGNKNWQIFCSIKCQKAEYYDRIRFDDGSGSKSNNRIARLELDKYTCRKCGEDNPIKLIVHHNKYPATVEELITLCRACHAYIHKKLKGKFYPADKT